MTKNNRVVNLSPSAGDLLCVVSTELSDQEVEDLLCITREQAGPEVGVIVSKHDMSVIQVDRKEMEQTGLLLFVAPGLNRYDTERLQDVLDHTIPEDIDVPFLVSNFALDVQSMSQADLRSLRDTIDHLIGDEG